MLNDLSKQLQKKYRITAWIYDILDYPWERQYRLWRPKLLADVRGKVLEAGVGTGRNFEYYHTDVHLTGIDLSPHMLTLASKRALTAGCHIELINADASDMSAISEGQYDWLVSTFLCCVMPNALQPLAIDEFVRVLKPGGHFTLLEMVFSKNEKIRRRQERIMPVVEWLYGARFDRNTLALLKAHKKIKKIQTRFLKDDTYLLIEGITK